MTEITEIPEVTEDIKKTSGEIERRGAEVSTNQKRYDNWVEVLTTPFKKKEHAPCYKVFTQLDPRGREILRGTNHLLKIHFPTSLDGLYRVKHEAHNKEHDGILFISKDDKATLFFPSYENVYNDGKIYNEELIEGNYRDVVGKYFEYIKNLMYTGYNYLETTPQIKSGSFSFSRTSQLNHMLNFFIPDWIDDARFNSQTINIYLFENYLDLDKHFVERKVTPFIICVPGRDDHWVPAKAKKIAEIPCEYGTGIQDSQVIKSILNEINYLFSNELFLKKEREKFIHAYKHLWQLGQGDGLFNTLKLDFDTFYYYCFLSISFDCYFAPA